MEEIVGGFFQLFFLLRQSNCRILRYFLLTEYMSQQSEEWHHLSIAYTYCRLYLQTLLNKYLIGGNCLTNAQYRNYVTVCNVIVVSRRFKYYLKVLSLARHLTLPILSLPPPPQRSASLLSPRGFTETEPVAPRRRRRPDPARRVGAGRPPCLSPGCFCADPSRAGGPRGHAPIDGASWPRADTPPATLIGRRPGCSARGGGDREAGESREGRGGEGNGQTEDDLARALVTVCATRSVGDACVLNLERSWSLTCLLTCWKSFPGSRRTTGSSR